MPEPAAPKGKGKGLKKLPPWAWAAAILGGLVVGYLFLRKPSGAPSTAAYPPDQGTPLDQASSGTPAANGAPADSMSPAVLEALGLSLGQLGSLGGALGDVAMNATDTAGRIAETATVSSFDFGSRALEGGYGVSEEAIAAITAIYSETRGREVVPAAPKAKPKAKPKIPPRSPRPKPKPAPKVQWRGGKLPPKKQTPRTVRAFNPAANQAANQRARPKPAPGRRQTKRPPPTRYGSRVRAG